MNEAETRAEYIDPALAAAGWGDSLPASFGGGRYKPASASQNGRVSMASRVVRVI